jgi:formamidopyrimidine-DNA glycosylase
LPELPEVEGLARFLDARTGGRRVERVDVVSFAALKTALPPATDLVGRAIAGWGRRGKFLVLRTEPLMHLVVHFAQAGWVRWHEALPASPPARPFRPGPVALRVALEDGSGFELTEAGSQKRLAVYVIRQLTEVPGIASLGIDPLDPAFTPHRLGQLLGGRKDRLKSVLADQSVIAGVGNAPRRATLPLRAGRTPLRRRGSPAPRGSSSGPA